MIVVLLDADVTDSFILTMRNVNSKPVPRGRSSEARFILTMRNVNGSVLARLLISLSGFILTMRNVNLDSISFIAFDKVVLY